VSREFLLLFKTEFLRLWEPIFFAWQQDWALKGAFFLIHFIAKLEMS
jgi:hypothetical protein